LVVVHTDSGVGQGDYDNRNIVLDRLDSVAATFLSTDADIVIIGDFNTMGTGTKPASVELSEFSAKVGNESPGFIDVPVEPQCTEYYRGNGGWLDHAVVTAATRELAVQQAVVHGYCNMANCDRLSDMPNAYEALSDHCPVVIDFQNTDID
jgi:exonuclease III